MASQSLIRVLALKARAERLQKERQREEGVRSSQAFNVRSLLFQRQIEVLDLVSKSRFHGICGTRRSGKTNFLIALLFEFALTRGLDVIYVGLTKKAAKRIIWEPPQGLGMKLVARMLGCDVNEADLSIRCPNGAHIYVEGLKDDSLKERFRGPSNGLVVIDECQSLSGPLLGQTVGAIIEPAIGGCKGTVVLAGTPGEFCNGLFWEVVGEKVHPKYIDHFMHWSDNPYTREGVAAEAEARRQAYGDDDPTYLREYCGKWVPDKSSLCFPNFTSANEYLPDEMPSIDRLWYSGIGIDVGSGGDNDPATIIRGDVFFDDPRVFLSELTLRDAVGKLTDSDILEGVRIMSESRNIVAAVIDNVIGIGPAPGRNFPIKPAKKLEKAQQMRRIDDDFKRDCTLPDGRKSKILLVPKGSQLSLEARTMFWDKKQLEKHKKVPTSAVPNDHWDGGQYMYTELCNLQVFPERPETLDERMRREALEAARGGNVRDWKSAMLNRAS